MTYSNRPVTSPFQHRSEFDKSPGCLKNALKENPFLNNMPGTWSTPYPNEPPSVPPQNGESALGDPEPSPICDWMTTMGDNTVSLCEPPYDLPKKVSCPMSRRLVPERNIDPGMWAYDNDEDTKKTKKPDFFIKIIAIFLILILVLQFSIRKK